MEIDPSPLQQTVSRLALAQPTNAARISLAVRLKIDDATPIALRMLGDTALLEPERKLLATALAELRVSAAVPVFLDLLGKEPKRAFARRCSEACGGLATQKLQPGSSRLTPLAPPSAVDRARSPGQSQRLGGCTAGYGGHGPDSTS